jgi:hypothetical protein
MSRRTSIVQALTTQFKTINGTGIYKTNLFNNAFPILKFWDEIDDAPAVYTSPGSETRQYELAGFKWGFLNISTKVYTRGEDAQTQLEDLLEDIEECIDLNSTLVYDSVTLHETTDILIMSIVTDEGLLAPWAVGEINMQVRYQIMSD